MSPTKACPVVTRIRDGKVEVLAFRHPLAGLQLVKGGIEPGEAPDIAALRELSEEAGIHQARIARNLGVWESGFEGQVWAIYLVEVGQVLPGIWSYETSDDDGQTFEFFWHDMSSSPTDEWHPQFVSALGKIKEALALDKGTVA